MDINMIKVKIEKKNNCSLGPIRVSNMFVSIVMGLYNVSIYLTL